MKKILKGFVFLLVGVVILGVLFGGDGDTAKVTDGSSGQSVVEKSAAYEISELEIEEDAFAMYVKGILKNNTNKEKTYVQIQFPAYDADGNKLGDALDNINNLAAGQTWKFKAMYFGEKEEGMTIDIEDFVVDGF